MGHCNSRSRRRELGDTLINIGLKFDFQDCESQNTYFAPNERMSANLAIFFLAIVCAEKNNLLEYEEFLNKFYIGLEIRVYTNQSRAQNVIWILSL